MKIVYLHQYFNTPDMPGGMRSYEMARCLVAAGMTEKHRWLLLNKGHGWSAVTFAFPGYRRYTAKDKGSVRLGARTIRCLMKQWY